MRPFDVSPFPPFMIIVICFIFCLYTLDIYVAINMDPDQTAVEVDLMIVFIPRM